MVHKLDLRGLAVTAGSPLNHVVALSNPSRQEAAGAFEVFKAAVLCAVIDGFPFLRVRSACEDVTCVCDLEHGALGLFSSHIFISSFKKPSKPMENAGMHRVSSALNEDCRNGWSRIRL
jgi:hypothetical protein